MKEEKIHDARPGLLLAWPAVPSYVSEPFREGEGLGGCFACCDDQPLNSVDSDSGPFFDGRRVQHADQSVDGAEHSARREHQ